MSRPLRLLFVSHSIPVPGQPLANVGGMQRVATDLLGALGEHPDVELRALLLRTTWRLTHVLTGPFLAKLLWRIPRLARRDGIDVVLFSSMVTASVAVALRGPLRALGVRTAAIAHGRDVTLPGALYQRFLPHVFDALDAVLPVSRATGAECLARGLPPEKLHVVPNGIDVSRFEAPGDRGAARRRLLEEAARLQDGTPVELPADALLLCSVGRQVERKGFAWFVDQVMPRLPERVHYWLAGDGPEGEKIRAAVRRHRLERRVRLLGRAPESLLQSLYRGADLFVMPNVPVPGDMEGFGVVMLEAGLCGLPTVAANLEGIRDVVEEGRNGLLIESGDALAFTHAVLSYADTPERLPVASASARRYVLDTFTWSRVADRYVQVLNGLPVRQG